MMEIVAIVVGVALVVYTFLSAARTFVLPRSSAEMLTRLVFTLMRKLFRLAVKPLSTYEQRDGVMAMYAPLSLLALVPAWLFATTIGYMLIFWGMGIRGWREAFVFSGSSILTLGFATADTLAQTIVAFTEATVGLMLVAMLISYLPTMYSAFARREAAVSLLEIRAGSPPTAPELVWRLYSLRTTLNTYAYWESWEEWFTDLDESHTSLAALVFFRSPRAPMSWVVAAGTVIDGAALMLSCIDDEEQTPHPALVLRAGIEALRHIADFFRVSYNPDPHFPEDPIAISRDDFDAAWNRLQSQGVPLKDDPDLAWQNFAGWRVNYDSVLVALARLTMAPDVAWLSDVTFTPPDPASGQTGGELRKVAR